MIRILALFTLASLGLYACKDEGQPNTSYVPDVPVNITINTDLPLYYHLQTPGSYTLLDGGYRGVFLIHYFDDNYYAVERTCSFQSELPCSIIQIDTANIQLRCGTYTTEGFESCCNSQFNFQGTVLQSPATFPLKQYQVFKSGNLITVRN